MLGSLVLFDIKTHEKAFLLLCLSLISTLAFPQWKWQNPLPQGNGLNALFFTDSTTGYVVGGGGTILKTGNGGTVFLEEHKPTQSKFTISPNPANDIITFSSELIRNEEIDITILTMSGEKVLRGKFHN
ncbi:MAG: hypothetical protein NTX61_12250 [Bacteroidetes bacterium]|nr:hypothetical protein [Bacteroidota bacterium]